MSMSQSCGVSILPTLSRLLLCLVFISSGWNKVFTNASYSPEETQRLRDLGVEMSSQVVSTAPQVMAASFVQDDATADDEAEAATTADPTEALGDRSLELDAESAVGTSEAAGMYKIALMLDREGWSDPVWVPKWMAIGAGVTELVGGAMLLIGLFSRIWALGLAIVMGVAFYLTSFPTVSSMMPTDVAADHDLLHTVTSQLGLGLLAFGIFLTGPGPLSLDRLFFGKRGPKTEAVDA